MSVEVILPDALPGFEVFAYPPAPELQLPAWDGLLLQELEFAANGDHCHSEPAPDNAAGGPQTLDSSLFEQRLAEECARSFADGLEKGVEAGRASERELATHTQQRDVLDRSAGLVENFAREQSRYFESIEPEVVRLALAVAGRILRREAQMDPLLLTGTVRAALGQIAASSRVRLLVPSAELELWTEAMALLPNLPVKPAVVAGEGLQLGDCLLESDLGSADLGISAQLAEMERTFFDGSSAMRRDFARQSGGETFGPES
jgi:flagellar biosynthesis/type III secretory pathway protein FliH